MKHFTDKVAAITGAASGIGRGLALELAGRGAHLALSDVNADGLAETAALVADAGVTVTTSTVDVADSAAVLAWADATADAHGKVNLIFNNAGVAAAGTVEDTPIEDYEWLLGINLFGVIYGTKAFLPHLRASGEEGHIVNVSSIFGIFAQPTQSAYNASKFAVRGFTESLRQELDGDGGRVSATSVHPGGIATNIANNARMRDSVGAAVGGKADAAQMRGQMDKVLRISTEDAANTILKGVQRNARRVLIGPEAYAADLMARTIPSSYQRLLGLGAKLPL